MQNNDAMTPLLYPDLMDDNGFVTSLFPIKLETKDKSLQTTYVDYIAKHQKKPWWSFISTAISQLLKEEEPATRGQQDFDPYNLTKNFNGTVFNSRTQDSYEEYLDTWFPQVCKKLKPNGSH